MIPTPDDTSEPPGGESPDSLAHLASAAQSEGVAAVLAVVYSLCLDMARIPLWSIREAMGINDDSSNTPTDELAELVRTGWLVDWDSDDGPGVTLTSWAAERFGLRLNTSSEWWVSRATYKENPEHLSRGRNTITEVDLVGENATPLDRQTDIGLRNRIDRRSPGERENERPDDKIQHAKYEAGLNQFAGGTGGTSSGTGDNKRILYRDLLALFAQAIHYTNWSCGKWVVNSPLVIQGVPAWPLPGQDKGPNAPGGVLAAVSEWEAQRGKGKTYVGVCWACKGSVLRSGVCCDVCDRGSNDSRIPADLRLKIAKSKHQSPKDGAVAEPATSSRKARSAGTSKAKKGERGKRYDGGGDDGLKGGIGT